ncbi:MAG: helix-turn-helix domain-containing protein [Desulfovibrio sp.]|nr:helix-turn-helix domain-containing protein [Desulfovibrio sp.]
MEDTTSAMVLDRMLEASGLRTDSELSQYLGITSQAVSKARKNNRVPVAWVPKFAAQFNLSTDWLFWGKVTDSGKKVDRLSTSGEILLPIPIVEARLSAGHGSLQVGGKVERYHSFPSSFLHRLGNPKNMVLMQVDGDSMQPEILDGDIVLLDQSKKDIRLGRIYAVGFEEAIYLKRIDMLPGKVILRSVNPEYSPVEIDVRGQLSDQFRVIGQVLWVGREYR